MRFILFLVSLLLASQSISATELKISTLYPPGSAAVKSLQETSKRLRDATNGEVTLKVYPGGVMGDDNTVLRKMRIGQLQGALVSGTALDIITPNLKDISRPFQFDTLDEVYDARENKDVEFRDRLKELSWASFGPIDGGFSYLMSKDPVRSLEDIRNSKIWLPNTQDIQAMANEMDVDYLVMNIGDVLTGLDTGAIDTLVAPPSAALTLNWHSRFDFYTETPVVYTWGMLILPERSLARVSREHREHIDIIFRAWAAELDQEQRAANKDATQAIQQLLVPQPFSSEDINLMRKARVSVVNR